MKGFSTLELLIAFSIATSTILCSVLLTLGSQPMLHRLSLREHASPVTSGALARAVRSSTRNFSQLILATTTYSGIYTNTRSGTFVDDDDLAMIITATTSWMDDSGMSQEDHDSVHLFDITNAHEASPCNQSLADKWNGSLRSFRFTLTTNDLLTQSIPNDSYVLGDIAVSQHILAISAAVTGKKTSPSLFFFSIPSDGSRPVQIPGTFDNASSSGDGYTALAAYNDIFFAGNGFGSASERICSLGSCDQLQVFSLSTTSPAVRLSSLLLSTAVAPFAQTATGATAPVKSLTYKRGYVYLGLQKTAHGDEFNIIDVHNPQKPLWRGGISVGRTVNSITVYRNRAYLSTDDSDHELSIVDIADPDHPFLLGYWNAPGSIGFGFGRSSHVRNGVMQFGRSFVNNAPELFALDVTEPSTVKALSSVNIGTAQIPKSVVSLLAIGSILFTLTNSSLQRWSIASSDVFTGAGPELALPQNVTGVSLACSGNTLFVGENGGFATPSVLEMYIAP